MMFCELERVAKHKTISIEEKEMLISIPREENIKNFLLNTLNYFQSPLEIILNAILLLRLFLQQTKWNLRTTTWRGIFLISLQLAHKFHGFEAPTSHELSANYPVLDAKDFKQLERVYLKIIRYHLQFSDQDFKGILNEVFFAKLWK